MATQKYSERLSISCYILKNIANFIYIYKTTKDDVILPK